jgi:hypothetical protein
MSAAQAPARAGSAGAEAETTLPRMGKGDRNDHLRLRARSSAARAAERAKAVRIVEGWNAELARHRAPLFSPTLGAAFLAGRPWLRARPL